MISNLQIYFPVKTRLPAKSLERFLEDYAELEPEDIRACLAYAHAVIAHDSLDKVQIRMNA